MGLAQRISRSNYKAAALPPELQPRKHARPPSVDLQAAFGAGTSTVAGGLTGLSGWSNPVLEDIHDWLREEAHIYCYVLARLAVDPHPPRS
jgi:hypothetical protein